MFNSVKLWGTALTLGALTALSASAITPYTSIDNKNPDVVVKNAVDNTFEILRKYSGQSRNITNPALVKDIKTNVLPYFYTQYIAATILGPYYRNATPAQFKEFTATIEDYMVNAYIEGLNFYNGQKVTQDASRMLNDRQASTTVNVHDRNLIPVTFELFKAKDGSYRIFDFNALGISIISTKKVEWSPILRTQGITGLTNYVRNNNQNILSDYKK